MQKFGRGPIRADPELQQQEKHSLAVLTLCTVNHTGSAWSLFSFACDFMHE